MTPSTVHFIQNLYTSLIYQDYKVTIADRPTNGSTTDSRKKKIRMAQGADVRVVSRTRLRDRARRQ